MNPGVVQRGRRGRMGAPPDAACGCVSQAVVEGTASQYDSCAAGLHNARSIKALIGRAACIQPKKSVHHHGAPCRDIGRRVQIEHTPNRSNRLRAGFAEHAARAPVPGKIP